jgi:hypothetical protein
MLEDEAIGKKSASVPVVQEPTRRMRPGLTAARAERIDGTKPVDAKQIGRELGVRYVLEGSVRRSDHQVRINAQLIDAETAAHLWAERFDRDTGDLFTLQNEITSRIAVALNVELIAAEAARPSDRAASDPPCGWIGHGRARCQNAMSRCAVGTAITRRSNRYRRARGLDPPHRRDKAVAAPGHCLDAAAVLAVLIEDAAQRRNLDGQVAFLDHHSRPDGLHDCVFGDQLPLTLDQ